MEPHKHEDKTPGINVSVVEFVCELRSLTAAETGSRRCGEALGRLMKEEVSDPSTAFRRNIGARIVKDAVLGRSWGFDKAKSRSKSNSRSRSNSTRRAE